MAQLVWGVNFILDLSAFVTGATTYMVRVRSCGISSWLDYPGFDLIDQLRDDLLYAMIEALRLWQISFCMHKPYDEKVKGEIDYSAESYDL
jgi:hypothetical protein